MGSASPPSVFVSYSHDSDAHAKRVLALADRLRGDGIDARLDQYIAHPPQGWPRWMQQQAVECRFVLLVCTPTFRQRFDGEDTGGAGNGVKWEGLLAQQILYEAGTYNDKLVPVLFEEGGEDDVPLSLRAYTRYRLEAGYDELYRRLTGQPLTPAPPVGARRVMPPAPRQELGTAGATGRERVEVRKTFSDEELVDELARVLSDGDEAKMVARRAGFSPANIPSFRVPLVFWSHMVDAARNGMIAGGVKAVAEAAAIMYPGNSMFHCYESR